MHLGLSSVWLGGAAALLVGISKTGMPGAALPAVALMAEAFRDDAKLSVGAMLPLLILGDLFALHYYRRHADWQRLVELVPYVAIGMIPGYLVLDYASGHQLRRMLGVLILGLTAVQIARQRWGWDRLPDQWWFVATAGVLAGFGTTVGNAAGPVMSIYLISKRLDKHQFLGTAAWFFFVVNLSKLPLFIYFDMITRVTIRLDMVLVPVAVTGAVSGLLVLKKIPQSLFDLLVLALAAVAGVNLIVS